MSNACSSPAISEARSSLMATRGHLGSPWPSQFQHSPAGATQSKGHGMMHDFPARERLREDVSSHVIGGAIGQRDFNPLNGIADEVKSYVDVLGTRMVVVSERESNSCLIITEE